jgi:hypothetical protein
MDPLHVEVTDIRYRRPGLTKVSFIATYPDYTRRGEVVYDTIKKIFVTHTKDIALLAAICVDLQRPRSRKVG